MKMTTKTYTGVTAAKVEELKSAALKAGIEVKPDPAAPTDINRCVIHKLTVTAQLNYDPHAQMLSVVVSGLGAATALKKIEQYGGLTEG